MDLYNDTCKFYMEMYKNSNRQDFVEEYIEYKVDELLNAYTSILVYPKQGHEYVNSELASKMKHKNQFNTLCDYINDNKEKVVCLTDDILDVNNKLTLNNLVKAILGKEIIIHLFVEPNNVFEVNQHLDEISKEEVSKLNLLLEWKYLDNGYSIQLEKRFNKNDILLRLYPDGKGVVISELNDSCYDVSYFVLDNLHRVYINKFHNKKASQIIDNPHMCFEDDRYFSNNSVLWYGLICVDDLAYDKLKDYEEYELKDYSNDEKSFEIIDYLFSIKGIKNIWEKHVNNIVVKEMTLMHDENKGISIEIDGIYCPKCRDLHPTLKWHDKYIDYLNKEEWINHYKIILSRFGMSFTDEDVVNAYYEHLNAYDIKESEQSAKCVICSSSTNFINVKTGNYVCSDECKYTDDKKD